MKVDQYSLLNFAAVQAQLATLPPNFRRLPRPHSRNNSAPTGFSKPASAAPLPQMPPSSAAPLPQVPPTSARISAELPPLLREICVFETRIQIR